MVYKSKEELLAAGYVLTPNIWHTGKGSGEVYELIVEGVRTFKGVDTDGKVWDYDASATVVSEQVAESPVTPVEPSATPGNLTTSVAAAEEGAEAPEHDPHV